MRGIAHVKAFENVRLNAKKCLQGAGMREGLVTGSETAGLD